MSSVDGADLPSIDTLTISGSNATENSSIGNISLGEVERLPTMSLPDGADVPSIDELTISDIEVMKKTSIDDISLEDVERLRAKFKRFRVLIFGRANAGKTTILAQICRSTKDQAIKTRNGRAIPHVLEPTDKRGIHTITDEITFPSSPGFVFHDSEGFECGSERETEAVSKFVNARSSTRNFKKQLHAIWVCIPTDNDRPLLAADLDIFRRGAGAVPIIVIFTKIDSRRSLARATAKERRGDWASLKKQERADEEQKEIGAFLTSLKTILLKDPSFKCRPKAFVSMEYMERDTDDTRKRCSELLEETKKALPNAILKQLLVSVQQHNLDMCTEYCLRIVLAELWIMGPAQAGKPILPDQFIDIMVRSLLLCFPHLNILKPSEDEYLNTKEATLRLAEDIAINDRGIEILTAIITRAGRAERAARLLGDEELEAVERKNQLNMWLELLGPYTTQSRAYFGEKPNSPVVMALVFTCISLILVRHTFTGQITTQEAMKELFTTFLHLPLAEPRIVAIRQSIIDESAQDEGFERLLVQGRKLRAQKLASFVAKNLVD